MRTHEIRPAFASIDAALVRSARRVAEARVLIRRSNRVLRALLHMGPTAHRLNPSR